jgi:transposase
VQYVRPYVRRNKTDRTDTEAFREANRCGGIQPVPVKTIEQQTLQALHRVDRQLLVFQSRGATAAAASAEVTTGTTSNSVMSFQFAIQRSRRLRS